MTGIQLKTILYVEDEPDIQEVARIALEAIGGFQVHVCSSGAEALNLVDQLQPDLIMLDVMMPEMDGPATFKKLRALKSIHSPIIFITAKIQPQEVSQLKELGALDVISKPFDPLLLSTTIQELWDRRFDNR